MKLAIFASALVLLIASCASAQVITTYPMGNWVTQSFTPYGAITTYPMGGGITQSFGPNGFNATTYPLGNGISTTAIYGSFNPYQYRR